MESVVRRRVSYKEKCNTKEHHGEGNKYTKNLSWLSHNSNSILYRAGYPSTHLEKVERNGNNDMAEPCRFILSAKVSSSVALSV